MLIAQMWLEKLFKTVFSLFLVLNISQFYLLMTQIKCAVCNCAIVHA